MGLFHSQNAPNFGFKIAAFLVPLAIQAGRGTLVFFFQLNPLRIQSRFSFGIMAATVLLVLSMVEAFLVMYPYGLSWTVSVLTLMIIGWLIEVMILQEITFATKLELFQNQGEWEKLMKFYGAVKEIVAIEQKTKVANKPNTEDKEKTEDRAKETLLNGDTFYSIKIDRSNPILTHNLLRLKTRFQERYNDSIKKAEARKKQGKAIHQTIEINSGESGTTQKS